VRAIQSDSNSAFRARAITRDKNSPKAQELAALGAEVVEADLTKPETIAPALRGAHGAFFVTFFWDHFSAARETSEARLFAEAAKAEGIKHAIWSTLEDVRNFVPLDDPRMPTLQGKYKVPHFDGKGEADAIFADLGVPTTYLLASFYWDNLIYFGQNPKPDGNGRFSFVLPMGDRPMAGIAAEDIGKAAYGVFKGGDAFIGKRVGVAGEHVTGADMARVLGEVLGKDIYHQNVSFDAYRAFGFPGADDLGNMFQFYHDFEDAVNGVRDVAGTRKLNPELQDFRTWATRNKDRIPLS